MVGNSIRSDINPALEAGANAILVETADPWEYDLVDPHSDLFHRVATFPQAVDLLLT
jgi:FMN phosphatase YigB (HAD superfamily)